MRLIMIEEERDVSSIRELITLAFRDKAFSDGTEQIAVDDLRKDGALSLSLVAVEGGEIVGQVCFSPAGTPNGQGQWFTLGPISVAAERQRTGIGSELICAGFDKLKERGACGCVSVGDPRYYSRHGFEPAAEHCPENGSEKHFQLCCFGAYKPKGRFTFHKAFT